MIGAYLRAVLRHWVAGLTGGVAAAALTAWAVTGNAVAPWAGVMFVVGALVVAPYRAWCESQVAIYDQEARLATLLTTAPRVKLIHLALDLATPRQGSIKVAIDNPRETTSFPNDWTITIRGTDSVEFTLRTTHIVLLGHVRDIAGAHSTEGYIAIESDARIPGPLPATGAYVRVGTRDIRGFEVAAEGFLGQSEPMAGAQGWYLWPILPSPLGSPPQP